MIDDALFVTGGLRSGTTLLANLLGAQDGVSLLAQPFPLLFVEAKRAYLRQRGTGDAAYPLGHLFLDPAPATDRGFVDFLHGWRTSAEALRALFETMTRYSGQLTRFDPAQIEKALAHAEPGDDFAAVVATLARHLAHLPSRRWFGSKEVVCEEFLPFLLGRGFRCALIVRDPRDTIASLNHGRGEEFGGAVKPTLFNVRSWRKSVAFALAMEGRPRFTWCRYEDLVTDPAGTLARLHAELDLGAFDPARAGQEIRDGSGVPWRGNSSWDQERPDSPSRVTTASVGVHHRMLDGAVSSFIEATCLPELQLLGYETTLTRSEATDAIAAFHEPYEIHRTGFDGDWTGAGNADVERHRLELATEPADGDTERWFLFRQAHLRLRSAFRP